MATPLGNPGDLSPRAREIISGADLVLAEDTRRSGLLLARCGIVSRGFVSLHEHNEKKRLPGVLDALRGGAAAALISDAGTPLLSDPGYRLVAACRAEGIPVRPVPGPSAVLAALSASGLPPQPFAFLGFPPRSASGQRAFFAPYANLPATLVFFERKDRLAATLRVAADMLGRREGCIARELTKTHEEFIVFTLGEPLPARELLGEVTVLLGPPGIRAATPEAAVRDRITALRNSAADQQKPKETARRVQMDVTGWTVKDIYRLLQDEPE